jgi:hypothetical protein
MWRTPNVRRESGKYKVAITPEELMEMSAEDYQALCSEPRQAVPCSARSSPSSTPRPRPRSRRRRKSARTRRRTSSSSRFKGQFPPSLAAVMAGTVVPTVGFHSIALQVTITANALGKGKSPQPGKSLLAVLKLGRRCPGQRQCRCRGGRLPASSLSL